VIQTRQQNGKTEYRWGNHGQWCDSRETAEEQRSANVIGFDSARSYDKDGRLHISRTHISKSCVNPYYGREIPRSEGLGLDPNRIYYLLRDPEELRKAAPTFARLPIFSKHVPFDILWGGDEQEKKKYIAGTIGSEVEFLEPYLDADVSIWDADAIAGIETDKVREFSCGYRYEPIMTTGIYNGQKYDGIMTQIQGNHLALVESGRAGPDVLAADQNLERNPMKRTKLGNALIVALQTAFPKVQIAEDSELEKALGNAKRKTFGKPERESAAGLILAMDSSIDKKQALVVMDALADVDDPEPTKKNNEGKEEGTKDCSCGAKDGKHAKDCKMGSDEKDEDEEDEPKPAKDKKAKDKKAKDEEPVTKAAMDSALEAQRAQFRDADQAKRDVRPIVGDVVAMDSADEIYKFALKHMAVDHAGVEGTAALKAIFNIAKDRQAAAAPVIAMDSAATIKRFPNIARVRHA
jgi:hypothetical protein